LGRCLAVRVVHAGAAADQPTPCSACFRLRGRRLALTRAANRTAVRSRRLRAGSPVFPGYGQARTPPLCIRSADGRRRHRASRVDANCSPLARFALHRYRRCVAPAARGRTRTRGWGLTRPAYPGPTGCQARGRGRRRPRPSGGRRSPPADRRASLFSPEPDDRLLRPHASWRRASRAGRWAAASSAGVNRKGWRR